VQRLSKNLAEGSRVARKLFTRGKMDKHIKIVATKPECHHTDECGCTVTATGVSELTKGLNFATKSGPWSDQITQLLNMIQTSYTMDGNELSTVKMDEEIAFFKNSLKIDGNITLINPPIEKSGIPASDYLPAVHPDVQMALRRADAKYLKWRFPQFPLKWSLLEQHVWSPELPYGEIPPLWVMVLRKESRYNMALGTIKGRGICVSAKANLFPLKYAKCVLLQNRDTHLIGERGKEPLLHVDTAMAYMYNAMGIKDFFSVQRPVTFSDLDGMYLGSAGGPHQGEARTIKTAETEIKVSPHGKKFELHEADINQILALLAKGEDVPVYWSITPKTEIFLHGINNILKRILPNGRINVECL